MFVCVSVRGSERERERRGTRERKVDSDTERGQGVQARTTRTLLIYYIYELFNSL